MEFAIKQAEFVTSAGLGSPYPEKTAAEIAIVGKSNVGKSSLINSLCNNKKLAKTSSNPGKTRLINFFKINREFYFVDLPGYGFARAPKTEKDKWGKLMEDYLSSGRVDHIFMLIDIRHAPTENDKMMYNYIINTGFPCLILANKADKLAPTRVEPTVLALQNELNPLKDLKFMPFSSEKRIYSEEVWKEIENRI